MTGITPSQSARNTIGPGSLLVIDEASMLSGPDLADLIAYAEARGARIILAGDLSWLQAVENGGGMSPLAARDCRGPRLRHRNGLGRRHPPRHRAPALVLVNAEAPSPRR